MLKVNKSNISSILNYIGLAGLLFLVVVMLLESAHKIGRLLETTKAVALAVFASFLLCGALVSGVVGAKGMPIERSKNPIAYWLTIAGYLTFVTLVLVKSFQT